MVDNRTSSFGSSYFRNSKLCFLIRIWKGKRKKKKTLFLFELYLQVIRIEKNYTKYRCCLED